MQNFTLHSKSVLAMQTMSIHRGSKKSFVAKWIFLSFFLLLITTIGANVAKAQSTKPLPTAYPFCPNCNSKDIKTSKITYLPKTEGNCSDPGEAGFGRFQFDLDVTANTRYGLLIYFDVYTTAGVHVGTYFDCMNIELPKGVNPIIRSMETTPGAGDGYKFHFADGFTKIPATSLEARHVFTAWDNRIPDQVCAYSSFVNGSLEILDCQKVAPKCKTYLTLPLINLYSKPSLTLTSTDLHACDASNSVDLEFTDLFGGDLYSLTVDGNVHATNATLSGSPIAINISSLSAGDYAASLTISSSISKCVSDLYEFTIHIGNNVQISDKSPSSQSVCQGVEGETLELSVSATGAMLTYQWYSRTSSNGAASPITDATASAYMAPISTAGTMYYYAVVHGLCGADETSGQVTLTVKQSTEISGQPAGKEICQDKPVSLSVSGVGENLTYKWYAASSLVDEGSAIPDATNESYDPPTSAAGTAYYYVVVHGDCGEDKKSDVVSVVVNPTTEIVAGPADAETCLGSSVELSVTASGKDLLYQWYSTDGSNGSSSIIIDATASNYSVTGTAVGMSYYFVVVTGECGDATSTVASVHVKEGLSISQDLSNSVVCKGGNAGELSVTAVNAISYQWYKSTNDQIGDQDDVKIDGATDSRYTPEASDMTMYYYVVVKGECEEKNSAIAKVEVVECGAFCTYSQGGFGSSTGSTHYQDGEICANETTVNAIKHAIMAMGNPIVLGGINASLTISLNDADKVIEYLPAGGGAAGLPGGNHILSDFISSKYSNGLLAQAITLALNIGLNKDNNILNYPLQAKFLMLDRSQNCGIDGSTTGEMKCADFTMLAGLQDQDGVAGITINDVWLAANKMLNNGNANVGISIGQMAKLVEALNLAWDECRIAKQWVNTCGDPVVSPTSLDASITSKAYPNPYRESFTIDFVSNFSGSAKVEIFDITGRLLEVVYKSDVIAGVQNKVRYNSKLNTPSAIIYRVTVGQSTIIGRMLSAR